MTPEERLNQFEPLLSETMAILDRHTAQLKQHTVLLNHLVTAVAQQSENISFLLQEQAAMKSELVEMRSGLAEVQNGLGEIKSQQTSMDRKLDLILNKLSQ